MKKCLVIVGMVVCALGELFLGNELQEIQVKEAIDEDRKAREEEEQ